MDAKTLAAVCMLHLNNPAACPAPAKPLKGPEGAVPSVSGHLIRLARLRPLVSTPEARDAMARIVIAEAGNQGESGMAGVVYAILNRLSDGRWGASVEAVVDAPGQFEPVKRAGGSWRGLPRVSEAQAARVSTIVNLAIDGRLPDLTGGARYFQNPQIVAARARAGMVSAARVNFGGTRPSAVIGAHAFYPDVGTGVASAQVLRGVGADVVAADSEQIFVGENRAERPAEGHAPEAATAPLRMNDGIFVR